MKIILNLLTAFSNTGQFQILKGSYQHFFKLCNIGKILDVRFKKYWLNFCVSRSNNSKTVNEIKNMRVQNMLFDAVLFWSLIIIKLDSKFHIFRCKRI